ncbi:hypothetical protein JOQ06_025074 [Pogonophryne albipinna]|uniref:Uncharacterized protein n=1 Tax=Pogonophryne albipinna TaxID=1090488 RepID=A0AAD6AU22_9TELE|nr:hypothetical protein JOQ06_025074 [Pogonophryne albipinna]
MPVLFGPTEAGWVTQVTATVWTDATRVEAQREEEETQPEEVAAGPSEATTGDASPTAYPSIWKGEQYEQFKQKNEWMYAHNGRLGCSPCHDVKDLGVMASRGVNIAIQWADGKIIPAGQSRDIQLSSLRKKIREHKNSAAHNEAVKILQTANKDILLNMNASSQESVFESTAKASVDGDMEPIAFPLDLSPKNMRQLSECAHNLDIALRRIGKVFSVRW